MSFSKVLLYHICIVLLLGLNFVQGEDRPHTTPSAGEAGEAKGNCTCGGFPSSTINVHDLPLLSQAPGLVVKCDSEGENTCKSLCNALATATKAKGPEVLCNRLKNANELKLSAFFKVCDMPWTYANLTADEPLCCDEAKVKMCPSTEKNNTTATVETKPVV